MPVSAVRPDAGPVQGKRNYGWVIVIAGTLMMAVTYGLMYSYSVFFKPMAEYFNWDRATVSSVYSASLIFRGAVSIGAGWLADRYGARKVLIFCGLMMGLGLVLSSRVTSLWQFFLTYAVIESIGLSGTFGIVTALTSRWFIRNRGLALGIVSSGVGLGTLLLVPGAERLIAGLDWSKAFLIYGLAAGGVMVAASFFMRPAPLAAFASVSKPAAGAASPKGNQADLTLWQAIRSPRMIVLLAAFLLFFFCTQMVTVHLVNYATDSGIMPLVAASLISMIGVISIAGRLVIGTGAEKIGINKTLIFTHLFLVVAYVCLIFTGDLWTFYLFTVIFGFTYGGEVPQIPLFIGKFFGTRAMATLMGVTLFVGNIGGALGPWVAGKIFDVSGSYHWAFVIGAIAGLVSLVLSLFLNRLCRTVKTE
jgi:MFS family permease